MCARLEELAEVHGRARPGKPRVLILAPTAELAQQVRMGAFSHSPFYVQNRVRGGGRQVIFNAPGKEA